MARDSFNLARSFFRLRRLDEKARGSVRSFPNGMQRWGQHRLRFRAEVRGDGTRSNQSSRSDTERTVFRRMERTESEEKSVEDKNLSLGSSDMMWELSLPVGASRDHEYCNPVRAADGRVKFLPKCMVKGFKGDMLYDRQKVFVDMLKKEGVEVEAFMEELGYHGIEMVDPVKADDLIRECRKFIYGADGV